MDDRSDRQSRPLGLAAFEAMSAVEGLSLDAAGRARLKSLAATDLPSAERREAIRRAHRRR
jgi:hypothetical protein